MRAPAISIGGRAFGDRVLLALVILLSMVMIAPVLWVIGLSLKENAELMADPLTHQAHTAHTLNVVPLLYIGERAARMTNGGALKDVAPTLLAMMGLPQPSEMTGKSLISFS